MTDDQNICMHYMKLTFEGDGRPYRQSSLTVSLFYYKKESPSAKNYKIPTMDARCHDNWCFGGLDAPPFLSSPIILGNIEPIVPCFFFGVVEGKKILAV